MTDNTNIARAPRSMQDCRPLQAMIAQTAANSGMSAEKIDALMHKDTRPDPVPCPHCGKPMEYQPVQADGTFYGWMPFPGPCDNPACIEKEMQAKKRREMGERMRDLEMKQEFAGVPLLYRDCTLHGYRTDGNKSLEGAKRAALEFVRRLDDYAQLNGRGIVFCGPTGTGKSHLAAALVRAALLQGRYARYTTAAGIIEKLKQTFTTDETDSVMGAYTKTTLLVIDDLGKEHGSEWSLEKLLEIVDARYSAKLPTVYTANMKIDDLHQRMIKSGGRDTADALMSRIRGTSDVINVVAADYRMREETT